MPLACAINTPVQFPERRAFTRECRKQWAMQVVGAEAAWDLSVGGRTAAPPAPLGSQPLPPPPYGLNATGLGGSPQGSSSGFVTVCVVDSGEQWEVHWRRLHQPLACRAARPSPLLPSCHAPAGCCGSPQASIMGTPSWQAACTRSWAST